MSTLAFSSLSKTTIRSPLLAGIQGIQAKKRWLHQSVARQAIMMPAMSPFMTEGTITRWKKKEGEAFSAGDILLQIESDVASVDVAAESPGILGKILLPDGSTNVPVEQVIALVVKDDRELAKLSTQVQTQFATLPYNPVPSPPGSAVTPLPAEHQNQPFMPPAYRSPSLFELHAMGYSYHRGMMMKHTRNPSLSIVPPSPKTTSMMSPSILLSASKVSTFYSGKTTETQRKVDDMENQIDGATVRRMIASNLARTSMSGVFDLPPIGDTKAYFDGIL